MAGALKINKRLLFTLRSELTRLGFSIGMRIKTEIYKGVKLEVNLMLAS